MSTISLPSERQIRHFFVADQIASQANSKDFIANASIGQMQIFDQDGNAIDHTSGALVGKDFYLLKKNNKGGISRTDRITPGDITYLRGTAPVSKTGKKQVFTLGAAPTAGAEYQLVAKVHYGNSEENFITFVAGDRAKTGDTATTLLTRLGQQMADNMARSVHTSTKSNEKVVINGSTTAKGNKYFTISVSGSSLTIQEKDWILEDFRVGLRTHDQLMFNFELQSGKEQENISKDETPGVYAKGQGYQIIELERFLVGHRAEFETKDVTLGFGRQYDTDIKGTYYALDLKYFDTSRDSEKHSDKMLTLVSQDPKVIDAFGFAIEAAMGRAEGSTWKELDPAQDGAGDGEPEA